ncbi:histidine phosphatase family protein [Bailinhaonella thermotolerans]|uniref:Histidine phosphatase family protein n=1 Tax=Bailinhaonella thermotolerans TaxID=1070861 RepID=A0A3A4A6V0_9ACTN|nr:histidine phosphatase family protein [Bailinhaonella thermotolerans]RJL20542.1 histidine phosphatase family protein [Bailinhaonella thermotolerans]
MNQVILVRHGETEWSRTGRHTGLTDVELTENGEAQARKIAPLLARRDITLALSSPAKRARRTAELAGVSHVETEPRLWEWDYGGYEGITTPQIRETRPGWYLWRDGVVPGDAGHPGETAQQVGARVDEVIARARKALSEGDVALFAHGHVLRVLAARWLGLDPAAGRLFKLDTATISTLGFEHAEPVIVSWNVPAL